MSDVRLPTPDQVAKVKAEWEEWRYNDSRMVPEVLIEAMDELILAAEMIPVMADALDDLADAGEDAWPGRPCVTYAAKVLARYRAAQGTAEDGASSAREASAAPKGQGANPDPAPAAPLEQEGR